MGEKTSYYTTLHGKAFEEAARNAMILDIPGGRAAFASFSAANWMAPYGRVATQYFYAERLALHHLQNILKLSPFLSGANVVVTIPSEDGLFRDTVNRAQGMISTSPVQTYLDLTVVDRCVSAWNIGSDSVLMQL